MRHGRKSRSKKFTGYKRHIATLVGPRLIVEAVVLPANEPEYTAAEPLLAEVQKQGPLTELSIDRGYLASQAVEKLHQEGGKVRCKPWPARNQGRFTKEDFDLRLSEQTVVCPAGVAAPILPESDKVVFPKEVCSTCSLRTSCTRAKEGAGRTLSLHPQEDFLIELRAERKTSEGRNALRQRVEVEHRLARIDQIQGRRARYRGVRKNTLDLRRCAAVANLQVIAQQRESELRRVA